MKKFFISLVFIGSFGLYAAYNYFTTTSTNAAIATSPVVDPTQTSSTNPNASAAANTTPSNTTDTTSAAPAKVTTPITKPVSTPVTVPAKTTSGEYTDGTYTGNVADAYYGNIQVEAIISGGKLANVVFLQYPNDRSTSISINRRAMPVLTAEAIKSQNANVNGVSGASDSSMAFNQSLASALVQAKA